MIRSSENVHYCILLYIILCFRHLARESDGVATTAVTVRLQLIIELRVAKLLHLSHLIIFHY